MLTSRYDLARTHKKKGLGGRKGTTDVPAPDNRLGAADDAH